LSPFAPEKMAVKAVQQGGHNIPEAVIRRRYQAGLDNFPIYAQQVNHWSLFNNDHNFAIKLASGGRNATAE